MIKRMFFVLAVTCFLSSPSWSASYGPYSLVAPIAIDGDTIKADVMVWPGFTADVSIRVIGVDTPEHDTAKCPSEKERSIAATNFTEVWLSAYAPISINKVKLDKFARRVDAVVSGARGDLLSDALIQSGHGRPYNGGARQSWCP